MVHFKVVGPTGQQGTMRSLEHVEMGVGVGVGKKYLK